METSGIEPEILICKIKVLPVKLYPLSLSLLPEAQVSIPKDFAADVVSIHACGKTATPAPPRSPAVKPPGIWGLSRRSLHIPNPRGGRSRDQERKLECYSNIRRTTRTFTKSHQYCLRIPCLPIPALGFMNKAKVS